VKLMKHGFTIFAVFLGLLLSLEIPVHAEWEGGVECQIVDGSPEVTTAKIGWSFSDQWVLRGIYSWLDNDLSAGVIYRKKPHSGVNSYVGLGVRDILSSKPDLSIPEKIELITGLEFNADRITPGLSAALEVRVIPNDLFNSSENRSGFSSFVGISINYRGSGETSSKNTRPGTVNESDQFLLAKLITAEAGSEPFEGQVAVGAVVINRMNSSQFPVTVKGVIFQPGQFSCVPKLAEIEPSETSITAAREALQGKDPTGGALYFYNPATCSPEGLRFFNSSGLKVTARIGNHVFLR
jgi:hypothetical protein